MADDPSETVARLNMLIEQVLAIGALDERDRRRVDRIVSFLVGLAVKPVTREEDLALLRRLHHELEGGVTAVRVRMLELCEQGLAEYRAAGTDDDRAIAAGNLRGSLSHYIDAAFVALRDETLNDALGSKQAGGAAVAEQLCNASEVIAKAKARHEEGKRKDGKVFHASRAADFTEAARKLRREVDPT